MKNYDWKSSIASMFISCALVAGAQTAPPQEPDALQQKIQQLQQARARNEQQLHAYQWIAATTLTWDGKALPPKQTICRYSADGTVLKTPLGPQEAQSGGNRGRMGGPIRAMIASDKKKKIKADVEEVHSLSQLYFPLDPVKFKSALHSNKAVLEQNAANADTIVLSDYAKTGDQVRLTLDRTTMQIDRVSVKTYLDKPKNVMTVNLDFSTLPDGTLYPALNSIEAPSKKLSIATVNSSFSKAIH
jgi:hypothetical protein